MESTSVDRLKKLVERQKDSLTKLRHDLHQQAERSGKEEQTSRRMAGWLEETDPDQLIEELGGYGLAAIYDSDHDGPTTLFRCELDALPIAETNDLPYQSGDPQTSHKCGHDGHMAIIAGLARLLAEVNPQKGRVVLLLQPSEETGEGAKRVLEDEKFKKIAPDKVFALHNLPGYPLHQVVVRNNVFAAASVGLSVSYHGSTAHAAHPEQGRSPAQTVSRWIDMVSALPQFETALHEAAKATVIHAKLGEVAFGTSPGEAEVMATLRAHHDEVLERMKDRALEQSEAFAKAGELDWEYEWREPFPASVNADEHIEEVRKAAQDLDLDLYEQPQPFAWSEDFGHFLQQYPGALFGLGSGKEQPPLHAPDFDFPDELIPTGVSVFAALIERHNGWKFSN